MTGAEFERYVGQVFHDNGHHAAVTKATGDYGVDLILNGYIAVQVKLYKSTVGPKAVQEVVAGRAHYKCTEAWVVTNSTFTSAAVALAESNGVRLIAGEELQWLADTPDQTADHRERYEAAKAADREEYLAEVRARVAKSRAELHERIAASQEVARLEAERRQAAAVARREDEARQDAAFRAQMPKPSRPGWYQDPADRSKTLYWSGQEWLSTRPVHETLEAAAAYRESVRRKDGVAVGVLVVAIFLFGFALLVWLLVR
jgi:hypothetical protein